MSNPSHETDTTEPTTNRNHRTHAAARNHSQPRPCPRTHRDTRRLIVGWVDGWVELLKFAPLHWGWQQTTVATYV